MPAGPIPNFALIAGFTEIGETLEETVHREVMEEVGLKVKNLRYYKNQPWSFSDSLLVGFFAELDGSPEITATPPSWLQQNGTAAQRCRIIRSTSA
jgi:NAD+ diphosphatase